MIRESVYLRSQPEISGRIPSRAATLLSMAVPMVTEIERATATDVEDLLRLLTMQFVEHEIVVETNRLRDAIRGMLNADDLGFILLAKQEGELLGCAVLSFAWTLEHGGKSVWLDELYVAPERRNQGVGSALVDAAVVEARKQGCLAIDLEVDKDHRKAENLYRRKGFRVLERDRLVKRLR